MPIKEQNIEDANKQRDLDHLRAILELKGTKATVKENTCVATNKALGTDYIIKMPSGEEIWLDVKNR